MVSRRTSLIDMGDLAAPKGSLPWVKAVHEEAKHALNDAAASKEHVSRWIAALQEDNRYRLLQDARGRQFMLWEDFCTTPQPRGLGYSPEAIEAIIEERQSVEALAAKAKSPLPSGRPKKGVSYTPLAKGVSSERLAARIARDRPDILERMKAGEFSSVRAAAKEAGIVRDPTPLELLKRAWAKAGQEQRIEFWEWVGEQTIGMADESEPDTEPEECSEDEEFWPNEPTTAGAF